MNTENCASEKQQQQPPKKCFCARCFMPIEPEDKVDVDGQHFHRHCSTCCICQKVPTSLKMFYGHVFCSECFKNYVLNRFRGNADAPMAQSNSWWLQWAPGVKAQSPEIELAAKPASSSVKETLTAPTPAAPIPAQPVPPHFEAAPQPAATKEAKDVKEETDETEPPKCSSPTQSKRCICARCLQAVDDGCKVEIGGQCFHPQCCQCYFCHCIPKDNVKIYYGQVFCEECFNRFVMSRNKDTPAEHFKQCFEQWVNNAKFAEKMQEFMSSKDVSPSVFVMQGSHPPYCRCGNHSQQDWFPNNEPRKSASPTPANSVEESVCTWDLSFENRTEVSVSEVNETSQESAKLENLMAAAEKIEKLTKYLKGNGFQKVSKKWKNFVEFDKDSVVSEMVPSTFPWVDLQDPKIVKDETSCPKCLWQCGAIYVNSEYIRKKCNVNKVVSC